MYCDGRCQYLNERKHKCELTGEKLTYMKQTGSISFQKVQEIQEQFEKAQAAIEGKIDAWYQRLAQNNGVSMLEAKKMLTNKEQKEFQWTLEEYIKYAKENEKNGNWEKELENASARTHISRLEALQFETQQELERLYGNCTDTIDRYIQNMYTTDFYHTAYEIQKGIGVGSKIEHLNADVVEKIVCKPWAVDEKNFSDRLWDNKTKLINEEFTAFMGMIEKEYVPGVSIYSDATKDGFETIAEAFVRIRNGENVPEKARKLVETYIERWKKE